MIGELLILLTWKYAVYNEQMSWMLKGFSLKTLCRKIYLSLTIGETARMKILAVFLMQILMLCM